MTFNRKITFKKKKNIYYDYFILTKIDQTHKVDLFRSFTVILNNNAGRIVETSRIFFSSIFSSSDLWCSLETMFSCSFHLF